MPVSRSLNQAEPKRSFLVVDDYGMGGIWMYIDAESERDIVAAYPELKVFKEPPDILSSDTLDRIRAERHFALDDPPSGYLADIGAARKHRRD